MSKLFLLLCLSSSIIAADFRVSFESDTTTTLLIELENCQYTIRAVTVVRSDKGMLAGQLEACVQLENAANKCETNDNYGFFATSEQMTSYQSFTNGDQVMQTTQHTGKGTRLGATQSIHKETEAKHTLCNCAL